MSVKIYFLVIISPVLVWSCGSDVTGTSSTTAEFGISFFAPLAYTYPPPDVDLVPGQSLTKDIANRIVQTDLDLAIAKGLTANQIYLYIPPTLNFTFTHPVYKSSMEKFARLMEHISQCLVATVTSTISSVTATISTGDTNGEPENFNALPRRRATSGVKARPFVQSMTVIATASQPLYKNQWKSIGRSVQQALEDKKLLFNDEISVVLL
ncbi:Protein CBG06621 [Caenorhabditis briggsae]|uniref:Protein CBG06621 n=1 Tax=Caenorhabditis briggsae TaxID=6238 RepID=A8X2P3_CAEBR|nr:Protein CBG06621 [Caenorhabditis briggsae]CAP26903.2 Protein CBG06621 [Caenorhabditis briggsae]